MKCSIAELMESSGVRFGTSGARGLATAMTDFVCHACTRGFLQYLESIGDLPRKGLEVAVAGDLRPSTDRIMEAVCRSIEDSGHVPVYCGKIPSPAVALFGLARHLPAIMVTGSHIPEDRNGIKFNKCAGEILKTDESGITGQTVEIDEARFNSSGAYLRPSGGGRPVHRRAATGYVARYLDAFPGDALKGTRLGVYQHSAVGRDLMLEILGGLGAETVALGRSDRFIPVDTEAIRPEDVALARRWATEQRFDAIVSADGDSDRPLISDARGEWLRGDVAGLLAAKFLGADSVSVPVSCNTAVEECGWFRRVRRTRIGSPFVVASMIEASAGGARRVVGYEANGGFLLNSDLDLGGRILGALPTRDAMIVLLGVLLLARRERRTVSRLVAALPARFTASDRLKDFPTGRSRAILARFDTGTAETDGRALEAVFGESFGRVAGVDRTDGLRIRFTSGEVVHLRASGNAPEFRCYAEAAGAARATEIARQALELVKRLAAGTG